MRRVLPALLAFLALIPLASVALAGGSPGYRMAPPRAVPSEQQSYQAPVEAPAYDVPAYDPPVVYQAPVRVRTYLRDAAPACATCSTPAQAVFDPGMIVTQQLPVVGFGQGASSVNRLRIKARKNSQVTLGGGALNANKVRLKARKNATINVAP